MKYFFLIQFLVYPIVFFGQSIAKDGTNYIMPHSEIRNLKSTVNNVDYKLYISYPQDYEINTSEKFDVLYLLDADYSFAIGKNIVTHLSERNHLNNLIIVGIGYGGHEGYRIHRTRDYTPSHIENSSAYNKIHQEHSGGGKLFKEFLKKELIPFIEREYCATEHRVLTGHSYGGLFASWILLTEPELFDGYIIVSPSLWYDEHILFRIPNLLEGHEGKSLKAYFAVGDREVNQQWNMPGDLNEFVQYLISLKPIDLKIKHEIANDETHNSIFPRALSNGIRFVFNGT